MGGGFWCSPCLHWYYTLFSIKSKEGILSHFHKILLSYVSVTYFSFQLLIIS
nr:MAG TPA: hypothetical protein [Caudoviricetes sp.]